MRRPILPKSEFRPTRSKYLVLTERWLLRLLILGTLVGLGIYAKEKILVVANIKCEFDYEPCKDAFILAELERLKGKSLLEVPRAEVSLRLRQAKKTVGAVEMHLVWPNTLSVSLASRSPKVALSLKEGGKWVVLGDDFVVLRVVERDPNVPTVLVSSLGAVQVGESISDSEVIQSLRLAMEISAQFIKTKSIELDGYTIMLTLLDGKLVFMSTRKDLTGQITTLQHILASDKIIQDKNTIDVRFNQPVLK